MSTLQIRQLESGAFEHIDSIDGSFFLGRFNFKQEFNEAFLVEAYGAKRRKYTIEDISVYAFGGSEELFTNWTDLFNRLVELAYTGIDTNQIPFELTAENFGTFSSSLDTEDAIPDAGIFSYTNILGLQVQTAWSNIKAKLASLFLSNDVSDYSDATLPVDDADLLLINQGGDWKKVEKSELSSTPYAEKFPMHYLYLLNGGAPNALGETGMVENSSGINNAAAAFSNFTISNNEYTCKFYTTNAVAGAITNVRNPSFTRFGSSRGFYDIIVFRNRDASSNSAGRGLWGLSNINSIGNLDPSSMANTGFGFAADSSDTNMQIFYKQPSLPVVKIPTSWSKNNTDIFIVEHWREAGSTIINYKVKNVTLNQEVSGSYTFIQGTAQYAQYIYKGSGANAIATGFDLFLHNLYTSV